MEARVGELIAVVGPAGAGKSALLGALAGDVPSIFGEVRLAGRDVRALRPRERQLLRAVLPQNDAVSGRCTVREAVRTGRTPYGRGDRAADSVVADALAATGATRLAGIRCPELPGAARGRVALARVLAQQAPLLLLDEPVSELSAATRERILAPLRVRTTRGDTVVLALRDTELARRLADRIIVLSEGRVRADRPEPIRFPRPRRSAQPARTAG